LRQIPTRQNLSLQLKYLYSFQIHCRSKTIRGTWRALCGPLFGHPWHYDIKVISHVITRHISLILWPNTRNDTNFHSLSGMHETFWNVSYVTSAVLVCCKWTVNLVDDDYDDDDDDYGSSRFYFREVLQ